MNRPALRRILTPLLTALVAAGCASRRPAVTQYGAMREVMREGRTQARVRLADAVASPHAYAVGAVEGLAGEITIADGAVWVVRAGEPGLRVTGPAVVDGDRATLLTLAHVPRWQHIEIETPAEGRDLEGLIERLAREHGLDASVPFPFVIEGAPSALDLHVINGFCPVAVDPATVGAEPWRLRDAGGDALVVGFYAADAGGVMTHHGSAVHMHAIVTIDEGTVAGHVDRLAVVPGMILRVPAARQ